MGSFLVAFRHEAHSFAKNVALHLRELGHDVALDRRYALPASMYQDADLSETSAVIVVIDDIVSKTANVEEIRELILNLSKAVEVVVINVSGADLPGIPHEVGTIAADKEDSFGAAGQLILLLEFLSHRQIHKLERRSRRLGLLADASMSILLWGLIIFLLVLPTAEWAQDLSKSASSQIPQHSPDSRAAENASKPDAETINLHEEVRSVLSETKSLVESVHLLLAALAAERPPLEHRDSNAGSPTPPTPALSMSKAEGSGEADVAQYDPPAFAGAYVGPKAHLPIQMRIELAFGYSANGQIRLKPLDGNPQGFGTKNPDQTSLYFDALVLRGAGGATGDNDEIDREAEDVIGEYLSGVPSDSEARSEALRLWKRARKSIVANPATHVSKSNRGADAIVMNLNEDVFLVHFPGAVDESASTIGPFGELDAAVEAALTDLIFARLSTP